MYMTSRHRSAGILRTKRSPSMPALSHNTDGRVLQTAQRDGQRRGGIGVRWLYAVGRRVSR